MRAPVGSFVFLAVCVGACSGSKSGAQGPEHAACPPGQTFDGQYCQVDQKVATAETPVAVSPPVTSPQPHSGSSSGGTTSEDVAPPDESTSEGVEEGTGGAPPTVAEAASPVDITMAAQAAPIIQYLASSHLPSGARQLGAPFAGQFAEGQVLTQKLQVVEGKCYTVVAVAMPPVSELNVLLFQEGRQEPLLEDVLTGTQAVIGSRDKCYRAAKSESLELVLRVEKGNGVAAGQVFQK